MQCPKCSHRIPDKGDRCLYCGALIKGGAPSEKKTEPPGVLVPSGKMGKDPAGIQVTKEKIDYKKLQELPLSLRAKVEEVLKKDEGPNEEIKNPFDNFPDSMERMDRKRKRMGPLAALKILLKKD
jgi:hypothetical protein